MYFFYNQKFENMDDNRLELYHFDSNVSVVLRPRNFKQCL